MQISISNVPISIARAIVARTEGVWCTTVLSEEQLWLLAQEKGLDIIKMAFGDDHKLYGFAFAFPSPTQRKGVLTDVFVVSLADESCPWAEKEVMSALLQSGEFPRETFFIVEMEKKGSISALQELGCLDPGGHESLAVGAPHYTMQMQRVFDVALSEPSTFSGDVATTCRV